MLKPSRRVEGAGVDRQTAAEVVGMDALRPAVAEFLRHRAAGELQPGPVEPVAELVRTGTPDHHRGVVGEQTKIALAGARFGKATHARVRISEGSSPAIASIR